MDNFACVINRAHIPRNDKQAFLNQAQREEVFFDMLRQKFRQCDQEKPLAIFDIDDVMHLLEHRIANDLGIDINRFLCTFSVRDNPQLTPSEKKAIIEAFANPKYFRDIEFLPGVERITEPQEFGALVGANSNAFSKEIGELKREQLLAAVPGLKPEQIQINVIHYGETHRKELDPRTTVLHDDSPFNVAMSPALLNSMPSWMPWTHSREALQQMASKLVTWHDSLNDMIDFTCAAVRAMRK